MNHLTLVTCLTFAFSPSLHADGALEEMNQRLEILRSVEQSLRSDHSPSGQMLPERLEDFPCLRTLVGQDQQQPDRDALRRINQFVIIPGKCVINADASIPTPFHHKQLYLISRYPNRDHAMTAEEAISGTSLGRYAILFRDPAIEVAWIPESVFASIQQQFPDLHPAAIPPAFEQEARRSGILPASLIMDPLGPPPSGGKGWAGIVGGAAILVLAFRQWIRKRKMAHPVPE